MKYLILIFPLLLISCSNNKLDHYHLDKWIGTWEEDHGDGKFSEIWTSKNDQTLIGRSFMTLEQDTAFSETIELKIDNDSVYYVVLVKDQNGDKPVSFSLTDHQKDQWTFENAEHDFPKKINYLLKGKDSMIIFIEGIENGSYLKSYFRLHRK